MQGKACLSKSGALWQIAGVTNLQEPSVDVRKLAGEDEACKRENKSTLT